MTTATLRRPSDASLTLEHIDRTADLVMWVTLLCSGVAALAIGHHFGSLGLAASVSAVLLAAGSAVLALARGRRIARVVLTLCNVAAIALHIQLGRGTIEFHFGVFVLLGLILVYRDWRPLVFAAGLFAVHHLLFDRLQAMDLGVYCTPEPDLLKTAMHAIYVVAQTGIEIYLAIGLRRAAREAAELSALVHHVDRDGIVDLDVGAVPVSTRTAVLLKGALTKIENAMTDVHATARSVEHAAREIASGNAHLSERTDVQAGSLQRTAGSVEELSGNVHATAATAATASGVADAAAEAATRGGEVVGQVVSTMDDISQSSRQIADISGVIDSIAFQTNILALNAAVEASRAGEQGRGFAVVAGEVRALAQRSAQAAKEIGALIRVSTDRVASGARLVDSAGTRIADIVAQAGRVSSLIGEISSAAGRQSSGIAQLGSAMAQLDGVTQQNAALVEESAAAAASLHDQVQRLNAVVQRFVLAPRVA